MLLDTVIFEEKTLGVSNLQGIKHLVCSCTLVRSCLYTLQSAVTKLFVHQALPMYTELFVHKAICTQSYLYTKPYVH